LARSLEIADLRLENCLVEVTEDRVVSGADGTIGADVFQEFLLRFDARSQVLELLPFQDHTPAPGGRLDPWIDVDPSPESLHPSSTPALHVGHLLAVKAAVDGRGSGLFVLDTGSAYNSVTPDLLGVLRQTTNSLAWRGAQGVTPASFAASHVGFRVPGAPESIDGNAIALDLSGVSQTEAVRISGLLGYSTLSKLAVTINFREGTVRFAPHDHR
jgi:hypothetical protein